MVRLPEGGVGEHQLKGAAESNHHGLIINYYHYDYDDPHYDDHEYVDRDYHHNDHDNNEHQLKGAAESKHHGLIINYHHDYDDPHYDYRDYDHHQNDATMIMIINKMMMFIGHGD